MLLLSIDILVTILKNFVIVLQKNIEKLTYNMYTFIICGDINIDLVKYDKDNKVNNYVNDIKSMGCIISIDRSTTMTETRSTILDHFLE